MFRQYVKAEMLSEEVFRRKAAGESSREIGLIYARVDLKNGLTLFVIRSKAVWFIPILRQEAFKRKLTGSFSSCNPAVRQRW